MPITGYMESSLATSEVFNQTINNPTNGTPVTQKAKELILSAKHLTVEDIEAAYVAVRQLTDTLTRSAMKAFDDGKTVLVYNSDPSKSINQALPFITFKMKGEFITYVFVDKYVSMARDGVLSMKPSDLRDLLIGAVLSNGIKRNYATMASNQYLQSTLMEIYCKFFTRILNREFSIMADKPVYETLQYWINRFFLVKILGTNETPENIESLAIKNLKFIDEIKLAEIKSAYDNADPASLSDLLNILKIASPRMKALNLRTFLSDWINYYYAASMLAVDNIEYLIFVAVTLLNGNNGIVSISASDIVKETKNIKMLKVELLKLI